MDVVRAPSEGGMSELSDHWLPARLAHNKNIDSCTAQHPGGFKAARLLPGASRSSARAVPCTVGPSRTTGAHFEQPSMRRGPRGTNRLRVMSECVRRPCMHQDDHDYVYVLCFLRLSIRAPSFGRVALEATRNPRSRPRLCAGRAAEMNYLHEATCQPRPVYLLRMLGVDVNTKHV